MPQISISGEIYQRLQALARPLEDTVNDVLRRVLDTAEPALAHRNSLSTIPNVPSSAGLITRHGAIPQGLKLRALYKGAEYEAQIGPGSVIWNGRRFSSLSAAAVAVINSTGSNRPTENGWRFWEYFDPVEKRWRSGLRLTKKGELDRLRTQNLVEK